MDEDNEELKHEFDYNEPIRKEMYDGALEALYPYASFSMIDLEEEINGN